MDRVMQPNGSKDGSDKKRDHSALTDTKKDQEADQEKEPVQDTKKAKVDETPRKGSIALNPEESTSLTLRGSTVKDPNLTSTISRYKCRLTGKIFLYPVISAADSTIYEEDALKLQCHGTNKDNIMYPVHIIKDEISDLLTKHPELKEMQYKRTLCYSLHKDVILQFCRAGQYNRLTEYTDFVLTDSFYNNNGNFIGNITNLCKIDHIIRHIIDNSIDTECVDELGRKPIHYIVEHCSNDVIKHCIDKGLDFECVTKESQRRPIHFLCMHRNKLATIQYLYEKRKIDIEVEDQGGMRPIHHLCSSGNDDTIKYLVSIGANIEAVTKQNTKPIHFLCDRDKYDMIRHFLDAGADLNSVKSGKTFIHMLFERIPYKKEAVIKLIEDLIEKGVHLDGVDRDGNRLIHYACMYATIPLIRHFVNKGEQFFDVGAIRDAAIKAVRTGNDATNNDDEAPKEATQGGPRPIPTVPEPLYGGPSNMLFYEAILRRVFDNMTVDFEKTLYVIEMVTKELMDMPHIFQEISDNVKAGMVFNVKRISKSRLTNDQKIKLLFAFSTFMNVVCKADGANKQ